MKTTKNDVTGDKLQTKPATDAYRDNYDKVFNKHKIPVPNTQLKVLNIPKDKKD